MKSKKRGLIIIILSSFAIVADAVLLILDRLKRRFLSLCHCLLDDEDEFCAYATI